jgi:hypothetical protein
MPARADPKPVQGNKLAEGSLKSASSRGLLDAD